MWNIFLSLALFSMAVAKVDYTGYRVFRVHPTPEKLITIKALVDEYDLDVWSDYRHKGDFMDFMVSPRIQSLVKDRMTHFGISYEAFIEDVGSLAKVRDIPPLDQDVDAGNAFNYEQYHTLDEINDWMDALVAEHTSVSKMSIGKSFEDRDIFALKFGTGQERSFVINCGIHSREWVSPSTCILTAKTLAETNDATLINLLNNLAIYIIPSANPDGYVYTWTDDRMWRKTRNTDTKGICDGVDPNRNFDSHFGGEGSSSNGCSDAYHGPSAFSETETQAQRDIVMSIGNVKGYIDIHAYSQLWMIPYGYTTDPCADNATLTTIAVDGVNAIQAVHGKTYEAGPIATVIYVASGSSADYMYDVAQVKCSFAAELRDRGRYGFLLPEDQIQPTFEETFPALLVIANAIVDGTCD